MIALLALIACTPAPNGHGRVAKDVMAPLGDPVPYATAEQLETFDRGLEVAKRRFTKEDGLGPGFNVVSCVSCHEKPVVGGSAGLYRNFFIGASRATDGTFMFGTSAGNGSGVVRMYAVGEDYTARPLLPSSTTIVAQRNPIPFFGVGLLAELPDDEILSREDVDDADGDGISGRANYDREFVGRFGVKSQNVSIEAFIRGPLNNHLGITSDPLTNELRARLPVDSSDGSQASLLDLVVARAWAQASAPEEPLHDADDVPDPELSPDDLFDVVSFSMLLAAPQIDPEDRTTARGLHLFDEAGCGACHTPRLKGPRGPLPVYSDLLLHDMGDALADGLEMKDASGNEFRTQPLWGVTAEGPYLHDGRAGTLARAIELHGGEGQDAADAFAAFDESERSDLVAFVRSLGGASQQSAGLVPPGAPIPAVGEYGGPVRELDAAEADRFTSSITAFDRERTFEEGVGAPRFNGDSCRACHFDPVIGGAGPNDVNVMRHGLVDEAGRFVPPAPGTVLHKQTAELNVGLPSQPEANVFEARNPPHLFGLGLVAGIPDSVILANADPTDAITPDGITGEPSWTDGARLGRFGWKAQVPTIREFARDAVSAELGLTLAYEPGLTFGRLDDQDGVPDPELSVADEDALVVFMTLLGPPPRQLSVDAAAEDAGEELFHVVGCDRCHTPSLAGADGPVPLYSDLLLHDVLPPGTPGIEDASATTTEFRTAPLWGLAVTSPYFHDGGSDTIEDAIERHDGESAAVRDAWRELSVDEQQALLAFLGTL